LPDFEPVQLFRKIYGEVFHQIEIELRGRDFASLDNFRESVEKDFCYQVKKYFHSLIEVTAIHKEMLLRFPFWENTYSNKTCLSCLARFPEHVLSCRHSLCDTCVIIYSKTDLTDHWRFPIEHCPLCNASNTKLFAIKPYTAGNRCLSIEGTSPYLTKLLDLEKSLKLPIPLWDCFDFVTGNGIGE
jgi:hypothetical protein